MFTCQEYLGQGGVFRRKQKSKGHRCGALRHAKLEKLTSLGRFRHAGLVGWFWDTVYRAYWVYAALAGVPGSRGCFPRRTSQTWHGATEAAARRLAARRATETPRQGWSGTWTRKGRQARAWCGGRRAAVPHAAGPGACHSTSPDFTRFVSESGFSDHARLSSLLEGHAQENEGALARPAVCELLLSIKEEVFQERPLCTASWHCGVAGDPCQDFVRRNRRRNKPGAA